MSTIHNELLRKDAVEQVPFDSTWNRNLSKGWSVMTSRRSIPGSRLRLLQLAASSTCMPDQLRRPNWGRPCRGKRPTSLHRRVSDRGQTLGLPSIVLTGLMPPDGGGLVCAQCSAFRKSSLNQRALLRSRSKQVDRSANDFGRPFGGATTIIQRRIG